MKILPAQIALLMNHGRGRRNLRELARLLAILAGLVICFSLIFQWLMKHEGQEHHSWIDSLYWTLVTMSTLGYGDIIFTSPWGRLFTMVVILSGMFSLMVALPFTFIKFFYEPWMEAQAAARAPVKAPEGIRGHVILTNYDSVTSALIVKLRQYGYPYVLLVKDIPSALQFHDLGVQVMVGELDNPATYRNASLDQAALVVATSNDFLNTNIAFTARELSSKVPIISTAKLSASVDILERAGSSRVLRLGEVMGKFLARRTVGAGARPHIIGRFGRLLIAEATAARTPLVGKPLRESRLREMTGITVVGVWERGEFTAPRPETEISANSVLVLAGSAAQMRAYDQLFCIYHATHAPVIIVGGGRVGRATARALLKRQIDCRVIEQDPSRVRDRERTIVANAAELEALEQAGIHEAPTVIITSHDDDTNIYLTIYCRRLRPDIQIISRATLERNVSTLHRAGADIVLSYASMGANIIFNFLKRNDIILLAEGLTVFRLPTPSSLAGKTIGDSDIRPGTGCSVIAISTENGLEVNPAPESILPPDSEMILIGSVEAEDNFLKTYGAVKSKRKLGRARKPAPEPARKPAGDG